MSAAPERRPPEERGALEVSPVVVRKVAQRVADAFPDTVRAPRRVVGEQGSRARVTGAGRHVDIAVELALRYPAPVRETTDELRRRIVAEVRHLTGYQVRGVSFTVSALLPDTGPRVR